MIAREDSFQPAAVGVALMDREHRLVDCDDDFCRIAGRSRSALLGRSLDALDARGATRVAETTHALGLSIVVIEDRSEAIRAEEQLREHTAILDHAQQIAGVGSWVWHPEQNQHSWSPQACRIYGMTEAEAATGDPAFFFRAVHPDDREQIFRSAWDSFVSMRKSSAEYRVVHPDGSVRWVRGQSDVECDDSGKPWRMIGVVVDVTERKLAEDGLREMTALLDRAHEVARLGNFNVDLATRRVTCRGAVARLLSGNDTIECSIDYFRSAYVHEDDRPTWSAKLERAYRCAGTYSFEHRLYTRDGEALWIRLHGAVEPDELGFPDRAVGVMQDVTEQRALEDSLLQVQKLDAVGQLAGGIAHDFNNLLLVIGGNAQLAQMDGNRSEEIEEIARATDRARDLVRQLLAFSRADPTEPRIMDVNDVVRGVRRMLERLIEETVDVRIHLCDEPLAVLIDRGRLEQVLVNLAVNARDAMDARGTLTVSTDCGADTVVLRISDTGSGMDAHTQKHVFDPFFTTKMRGRGTGLGLSTVYGIVADAGGRIDIDSELDRGTTFTITLPLAMNAKVIVDDPAPPVELSASAAGERVLLVEDDDEVRGVVASMLRNAGYEVLTASGAGSAMAALEGDGPVDAIICDLVLPGMSGTQLSAELRRRGHDLPTIYTSGYGNLSAVSDDGNAPVGFVAKPFSGSEVVIAIRNVLDRAA